MDFISDCPHGNINCSRCMEANTLANWQRRALAAEATLANNGGSMQLHTLRESHNDAIRELDEARAELEEARRGATRLEEQLVAELAAHKAHLARAVELEAEATFLHDALKGIAKLSAFSGSAQTAVRLANEAIAAKGGPNG